MHIKELKEILQLLRDLYTELDKAVTEHALPKVEVGCEPGCNHCCYIMTSVSIPEGMVIAEYVLEQLWWKSAVKKCRSAFKETASAGISRHLWLELRKPCPFLNKKGLCDIYPVRPSCCRYYYSADKTACSPEPGNLIPCLDLIEIEAQVWRFAAQFTKDAGFGQLGTVATPLSLMVLWCMLKMSEKPDQQKFIKHQVKGTPSPTEWLMSLDPEQIKETLGDCSTEASERTQVVLRKYGLMPGEENETRRINAHTDV